MEGSSKSVPFTLVAKITIVLTLVAVSIILQWDISQMNVKNVLLNDDLHDEVYLTPPLGISHNSSGVRRFSIYMFPNKLLDLVCKCSLY